MLTKNISVGLETVSMLTWFQTDWIIETITRYLVTHYGQMANRFLKGEQKKKQTHSEVPVKYPNLPI